MADNVARARVAVVTPSLSLSKSVARRRVRPGDITHFTLRVRNGSRKAVRNVLVCDRLARQLRYASSRPAPRAVGPLRCWRVASLGAGTAHEIRISARAVGSPGAALNRAFAAAPLARTARASRLVLITPRLRFTG